MFESWYSSRVEDEEPTRFWLEFQVISDGFEEADSKSNYYGDNDHENEIIASSKFPTSSLDQGIKNLNLETIEQQEQTTTITSSSSSSSLSESPQKFHLFPNLPAELRLKIWSCLIRPRIILAACLSSRPSTHKPLYEKMSQRPKRRYIPILLHICSESRSYALEHYELTFPWKTPHRLRASSPSYSYSSFSRHNANIASALSSSLSHNHQPNTTTTTNNNNTRNENDQDGYHPAKVYFNYNQDTLFLLGELEPSDGHGFNAPMVYFLRREDTSRVRHVACAFEELHLGVYDTDLIFGSLFHIVDRFPSARGVLPPGTIADPSSVIPAQTRSRSNITNDESKAVINEQQQEKKKKKKKKKKQDEQTHQYLIITTTPSDASIFPQNRNQQQQQQAGSSSSSSSLGLPTTNNVIQKLWRAWAMGSGYWPGSGGGVEEPPPPPPSTSLDEHEAGTSSSSSSSSTRAAPLNSLVNTQMVMVREEELAGFIRQIE